MNDAVLEQLRADVRAPLIGDKVTVDKRLKAEILQMRGQASIVEDKAGSFACEGSFGRGVANQKEASLFDAATKMPTRCQPYKSHLVAVHSTLCWAVLGVSIR